MDVERILELHDCISEMAPPFLILVIRKEFDV